MTAKGQGQTGLARTRGWPIALLLIVQLLSGVVISPQMSFFPIYVEEQLGYTTILVSTLVAIGQLLGMVAAVVGGTLCDALGRKWTLVLGLICLVFGNLLYLVHAPWLVVLLRAISGLGLGLHALGGQSYLVGVGGAERMGVLSALYNWGFTLGGALSNPGAGVILDNRGFKTFGTVLLAISLATALGAMAFLPHLRRKDGRESLSWRESLLGYGEILCRPVVVMLGLLRFLPTCYYGMATVLNPLLINRIAENKTPVALYTTLSLVMATLSQMLVGRAADRWGRRIPTVATFGVLVFSALGQASLGWISVRAQLWGFYTFGVLGICAAWGLSTLMPCLVSDSTNAEEHGRVFGMLHLLWNVGMIVGSMLGGTLVEVAMGLPFLVTALLNLGAIALAVFFFRKQGDKVTR
ncbi:MAG: MFS transporter [Chloroflexota bacterium]|nr:MFS transporter [Chloroflexota bacterium]